MSVNTNLRGWQERVIARRLYEAAREHRMQHSLGDDPSWPLLETSLQNTWVSIAPKKTWGAQILYEAWTDHLGASAPPWAMLDPAEQETWEAVARAGR